MLLTEREKAVLNLVLDGNSNSQIASRLGIKVNTVKAYKTRVTHKYRKFGFRNLIEVTDRFSNFKDQRRDWLQEIW